MWVPLVVRLGSMLFQCHSVAFNYLSIICLFDPVIVSLELKIMYLYIVLKSTALLTNNLSLWHSSHYSLVDVGHADEFTTLSRLIFWINLILHINHQPYCSFQFVLLVGFHGRFGPIIFSQLSTEKFPQNYSSYAHPSRIGTKLFNGPLQ